jgi:hypothetical protein
MKDYLVFIRKWAKDQLNISDDLLTNEYLIEHDFYIENVHSSGNSKAYILYKKNKENNSSKQYGLGLLIQDKELEIKVLYFEQSNITYKNISEPPKTATWDIQHVTTKDNVEYLKFNKG